MFYDSLYTVHGTLFVLVVLMLVYGLLSLYAQNARGIFCPLANRVVIVTGASAGIGRCMTEQLVANGSLVVMAARRKDKLDEVKAELVSRMGKDCEERMLVIPTDILVEADRKALIQKTIAKFGSLDCLILNAARGAINDFDESDETFEIVKDTMDINLFANVRLVQHALPHLKQSRGKKGRICVMSSLSGVLHVPGRTAYGAAKHAVMGFFGVLRCELKGHVRVTVVCPGFVKTEFHDNVRRTAGKGKLKRKADKFMTADECAAKSLRAIERGVDELILTTSGRLGYLLRPWFPTLIDMIAIRKAKATVAEA